MSSEDDFKEFWGKVSGEELEGEKVEDQIIKTADRGNRNYTAFKLAEALRKWIATNYDPEKPPDRMLIERILNKVLEVRRLYK